MLVGGRSGADADLNVTTLRVRAGGGVTVRSEVDAAATDV